MSAPILMLDDREQLRIMRNLVLGLHGRRIAALRIDVDDVVQDVMVRLLEAQRSQRSKWDPTRGRSERSYTMLVTRTAGSNALRRYTRWAREEPMEGGFDREPSVEAEPGFDGAHGILERLFSVLDLEEERVMAAHLAAGCTIPEAGRRMGLGPEEAEELGTRVRALLMAVRDA